MLINILFILLSNYLLWYIIMGMSSYSFMDRESYECSEIISNAVQE